MGFEELGVCWADTMNEGEGLERVLPVLKAVASHWFFFYLGCLVKDFTPSKNSAAEIKWEASRGGTRP